MKDITVSQDISHILPMKSSPLIRPLCVPITIDTDFPDEISRHGKSRVYSLWERLGLVYLEEGKNEPPQENNRVIVNNFTQQIVFQLFSHRNINRLIESNQPGFVLIDKVYRESVRSQFAEGKRISAAMKKRLAEKAEISKELESLLVMLSDGQSENDDSVVSADMAGHTLSALLSKAASEKRITERQLIVSERLLQKVTNQEKTSALLKELSELVREGGKDSVALTESVLLRISEFLCTETSPTKGVFLRAAAEKAAELAQENYTADEAKNIASAAVTEIFRTGFSGGNNSDGVTGAVSDAANGYDISGNNAKSAVSVENTSLPTVGADIAVGRILPERNEHISEAALLLLEQTEEELTSGSSGATKLSQLSVQEMRTLLKKTVEQNAPEISKSSSSSDVEKAVNEAVKAAILLRYSSMGSNRIPQTESSQQDISSAPGMAVSLMRRTAGYVSDKLRYERNSELSTSGGEDTFSQYRLLERADKFIPGSSMVSGSLSENHYLLSNSSGVYYAVSEDKSVDHVNHVFADIIEPNTTEATATGAAKPVDVNYIQNGAEITYTENREDIAGSVQNVINRTSATTENVQNIAGNTVNQNFTESPATGTSKPVEVSYTQNGAEITYTENHEDIAGNVQNVINRTSATTENVQNIAGNTVNQNYTEAPATGAAKPVEVSYTQNGAEITYTENHEDIAGNVQNVINRTSATTENVQNIAGNTVNQNFTEATATGAAKPVEVSYTQNGADITYTENHEDISGNVQNVINRTSATTENVQNIAGNTVNKKFTEASATGAAKPVEVSYNQNGAEITYTENHEDIARNVQNVINRTSATTENVQNIAGNTVNQNYTESPATGAAKPVDVSYNQNGAEITYTENHEDISGNVQNVINRNSATTENEQNIAGNTVNQNFTESPATGAAKPVDVSYTQNGAEITYTENHVDISGNVQNVINRTSATTENVQNIAGNTVNQNFTEAPATGTAKPVEVSYNQNGAEIRYIERPDMESPEQPMYGSRAVGRAERFYGKRSVRRNTSLDSEERSKPIERGRIIPAEVSSGISLVGGKFVAGTAPVELIKNESVPKSDQEISYRADPEIFRSEQRTGKNSASSVTGSYRDKLDSRTLETLDRIISQARSSEADVVTQISEAEPGKSKSSTIFKSSGISVPDMELTFVEETPEEPAGSMVSAAVLPRSVGGAEMRILLGQLRNAAKLKSALKPDQNKAQHISRLIRSVEEQEAVQRGEMTFSKSSYSFRTIDDGDNMVMLIPPAEADRYAAESGYARQLPPIEYKQSEEQGQPEQPAKKPKVINNSQSTVQSVRTAVSGGFENMTRAEINKLADMVYNQIQTRVMRERRRIGM